MGGHNIPNSRIHIDLAAFGITSLSIVVNIPDQSDASLVTPTMSTQLMPQIYQLLQHILWRKVLKSPRFTTEEGSRTRVVPTISKLLR
jgi:hypothetical protein